MLENPITVAVMGSELIVLTAAVGAVASNLWILPAGQYAEPLTLVATRQRLWWLLGLCLLGFTLSSILELLLRTASMSDLPLLESFAEIGTVLFKTHYGHLWLWRSAALLIVCLAWVPHRQKYPSRVMSAAAFIALAAIAITISAMGHAGDDGILSAANIANSLHIIGALLWGGGIIAMTFIILPSLILGREPASEFTASTSLRLSTLAGVALGLVLIPGIYNAWLQLDALHSLWTTLYGRLLVAKVAIVSGMATLGAVNRYRYIPAIQRSVGHPEPRTLLTLPRFLRSNNDSTSVMYFLRNLRMEMALLLGVLLLAAALSQQTPPVHAEHHSMQSHVHSDDRDLAKRVEQLHPVLHRHGGATLQM